MSRKYDDDSEEPAGAIMSPCGRYRYRLWRVWRRGPRVLFIGLNPSTADAERDDPTVRRCIGLAKAWGFSGMELANLFAYRATDPRVLAQADDPVGPDNDRWLAWLAKRTACRVACWGNHGWLHDRAAEVVVRLPKLRCLGVTKLGHPRHPLYLPANVSLARLVVRCCRDKNAFHFMS